MQQLVAVDVLHHHNGVVHQDADRENQRKQRYPVEGEAPSPGRKQRHRERQHHGHAHDGGLAAAQGQEDECHHRRCGEQQLLDELLGLVVGGGAVVAGFRHLHAVGNHGVVQLFDPLHHRIGDVDGVLSRLLGHREGHGRVFVHGALRGFAAGTGGAGGAPWNPMPDVAAGGQGTVLNIGHIFQEHRLARAHAHHEVGHLIGARQNGAAVQLNGSVAAQQLAHG